MNIAIYSTHNFERPFLESANNNRFALSYISEPLSIQTVDRATGCEAICIFVGDDASAPVLRLLHAKGVAFILLRSAGYNHVDIKEAAKLGIKVARVPDYSPYAIAEHCVALMLALNRKLIHAHNRIMEQNFSLDGLVGFDMHGKTVGIIGTGKIGAVVSRILNGFGCRIIAYDKVINAELNNSMVEYTDLDSLYTQADIITLHLPLTPETQYMIDQKSMAKMKAGVMLINTSRGALVHSRDLIDALKRGHVGFVGMDVYEEEAGLFLKTIQVKY